MFLRDWRPAAGVAILSTVLTGCLLNRAVDPPVEVHRAHPPPGSTGPTPGQPGRPPAAAAVPLPDLPRPSARPIAPRGPLTPTYRVATRDRVVFLTIDDGLLRRPEFLAHLLAAGVPVTVFPTAQAVVDQPGFFLPMLAAGASFGDHTVTHPALSTVGATAQQQQICAAASVERQSLGAAPQLFRPPYGDIGGASGAAAAACGMSHEVLWNASVNDGVVSSYGGPVRATNHLAPGDIMLMHLRRTFLADLDAALAAARLSNLRIAALTDYLTPTATSPAEQARQDDGLNAFPSVRAGVRPLPAPTPAVLPCRRPVTTTADRPAVNVPACRPED